MGIRGLSSFITQNPAFSKPYNLHDTVVIFDGSNLIHSLYYNYKLDFRYGGEYKRYYENVRSFISSFLECNIQPIMIFDGGQEKSDRKLRSAIERAEQTLKRAQTIAKGRYCPYPVFPLLVYEVFYSVIFDLGIPLANCDYAADDQVAVLGNYYNCPVISNDSDFYIFDIHKGFIHLDSIDTTINLEVDSDGKEYKYLSCKMYHIKEFVKIFPGLDRSILPFFGTLIGNEFVEPKTFETFFSNIQLPEHNSTWLSCDLKRRYKDIKIFSLLCWLQNKTLNEAVNEVTSYFGENEQGYIRSVINTSVRRYEINPCNLSFIFDNNSYDLRNDLLSNSLLITPCGNPLPQSLLIKFHHGHLPCFFINAIGLHRVFLQAQVEIPELSSSYSCSSYIRRILYGILVRHDINGIECNNQDCRGFIEEYDRNGNRLQKEIIWPLFSVEGIGLLPKVNEVHFISANQCIAILRKVLGVGSDYFLGVPDTWQVFIGSINYWLRISTCKSEAFVSALILNLIYFGLIKCKNIFINRRMCSMSISQSKACTCSSIICIAANVRESDLQSAGKLLEEYYINPNEYPDERLFLNISHSLSQLQSCFLFTTFLNQLLNDCLKNPAPQECYSGIMLYNLTEAIEASPIANLFIGKILGKDLNLLFTHLKSKVTENVHNFRVSSRTEPGRYEISQGRKKMYQH